MKNTILLSIFLLCSGCSGWFKPKFPLKELSTIDASILQDMRYHSSKNFIGRPISGYLAPKCYLSEKAARALKDVQADLKRFGLGLKVFDCYRPVAAINDFIKWSKDPQDLKMKAAHYPNEDKKDFWEKGYLTVKSSHARGSAVDVTLVDQAGKEIEMGTDHDFLDVTAAPTNNEFPIPIRMGRALLQYVMERHGFKPAQTEWWHFKLKLEPYPDTYFDELIR